MPIAPFIPLIASGISTAYDIFVGRKERQAFAERQEELARQDFEYRKQNREQQIAIWDKYVAETQALLAKDTYKYNQDLVDANIRKVELAVEERFAKQRPRILENLSTRGVRTSGISEYPLGQLEAEKGRSIADATAKYTTEELIAERNAAEYRKNQKIAFSQSLLNPGQQPYAPYPSRDNLNRAGIESAYLPLYNSDILNRNIRDMGKAAAFGIDRYGNRENASINTNNEEVKVTSRHTTGY